MLSGWSLESSCPKSRASANSCPAPNAVALYMDDMRASMSAKKVSEFGSPMTRRCAFVGHLRNAEKTEVVIRLFALTAVRSLLLRCSTEFRWQFRLSPEPSVDSLRVTRDEAKQRRGVGVTPDRPDHSPVRAVSMVIPQSYPL